MDDFDAGLLKVYPVVGRVVQEWVKVDDQLASSLGWLLGVDQFRARLVVSLIPTFQGRLKMVRRVAETYLDETALADLRPLLDRMKRLSKFRNTLAHNIVTPMADGTFGTMYDDWGKDAFNFQFKAIPERDVDAWIEAVQQLLRDWFKFTFEHNRKVYRHTRLHREASPGARDQLLYEGDGAIASPVVTIRSTPDGGIETS